MSSRSPQATIKSGRKGNWRNRFYWALRFGILLLIAVATFWGWKLVNDPQFMPITQVRVAASFQHVDQKTVASIAQTYVTGGFFTVDLTDLKQELLKLPWVYDVLIQRVWPDTVIIRITEQKPVAVWNNSALLNDTGDLFNPPLNTFPSGLPLLFGPDGQQLFIWQQYQQWNQAVAPLQLKIVQLTLSPRHSWQLTLDNGLQILLGREDVVYRLNRFITAYPQLAKSNNKLMKSVDLRYADGLAIQWSDGPDIKQVGVGNKITGR